MSQSGDADVAVVAYFELGKELVDGSFRILHDVAVRGNKGIGTGRFDSIEAFDQGVLGSEESVVVADSARTALESLLETVEFPDLAFVVDGVAAEHDLSAVDFHEVADGTVGVTGRIEDPDLGPVPGDLVARLDGGGDGNGFSQHESMGTEVVDIPAGLAIVPVALHVVEPGSFGIGHDEFGAVLDEHASAAGLIAMMVGEEDLVDFLDAEFGQDIGHRAVAAVEEEGRVARAEYADVDRPAVDVEVGGELACFHGACRERRDHCRGEENGDTYCPEDELSYHSAHRSLLLVFWNAAVRHRFV